MTINLSIRNYSLDVAGLNCTDPLVSFSGSDSKIDQSGLITFTGNLVLGRPEGIFESLDDRKNSRWSQGNPVGLLLADKAGTLRSPPRCGSLFILESSYSPKSRRLTLQLGDWLSLLKGKEPIGNASKICLGTSTSKSGLIKTLLKAAGIPSELQMIAVPGAISAPAPRLLEGSYIDQAGQVAASSGYFLYVENGVVRSRAIDAQTTTAVVRIDAGQVVDSERVAGQVPAAKLIVQAQCSITTPARDSYSAYAEQRGPALVAGVPSGADSAPVGEIVLKRTQKSDNFNRGAKTREITSQIAQCLGILLPEDPDFAGSTALSTGEYRRETHYYETNAPLTSVAGSPACQQGNQGRRLRTVIELYKLRGVVLRDVLATYPAEEVGDKTIPLLAEVEEITYRYDLGQNFQTTIGSPDDWTPTPLGDGPEITTRKFQPVGALCPNEFAYESVLTNATRMVECDRKLERWVENHQGEWEKSTQQYQSLILASSNTAEVLRSTIEDLATLVDALTALSVGEDESEFSNGGQCQPSAPTTYPAAFATTEKSVKGIAKLPANASTPYRQPEQSLSFSYLNSTSRAAAQGDATRLAKLWAPLLWGRYKAVSYTTDLADAWFGYEPLARVDAVEEDDRFAYLGDGFALAIAGMRCVVSIDGLYLGYLGADYTEPDTTPPIDVDPEDPEASYIPGAVNILPPEVVPPYVQTSSIEGAQGQAARLSYRLYTLDPLELPLQTAQGQAGQLTLSLTEPRKLQSAQGQAARLTATVILPLLKTLQSAQGEAARLSMISSSIGYTAPTSYWNLQTDGNDSAGALNLTNNGVAFGSGYGSFDGGDSLSRSNNTALQLGSGDWTILTWVYFDSLSSYTCILSKGVSGYGEYEILADPYGGGFYVSTYRAVTGGSDYVRVGNTAPATGTWHFLCAQYIASSGTLRISRNNGAFSSLVVGGPPRTLDGALTLGAQGSEYRLNGRMRYTGLFKGAVLPDDAIAYYYNNGNGRAYSSSAVPATGGGSVDRSTLNPITYTPTSIGEQAYLFGSDNYNPSKLIDGNINDSGMIADVPNGGAFDMLLTAAQPFYLNQLTIYTGQYNGSYNTPTRLRIYADQALTTLLYETTLTLYYWGAQTKDLSAVTALDTPLNAYVVVLDQHPGAYISVLELQLFGATASAASTGGTGGSSGTVASGLYSSTQVAPLGSAGMTNIYTGSVDDANINIGDLGFDFPYYDATYRNNVFIGSNSYVTFGFGSSNYSGLSRTNPGRALHLGSADRGYQNVFVKASNGSYRVRYEGSPGTSGSSSRFLEITFFPDGTMMVARSTPDNGGLWTATKGDGTSYTDFAPTTETSFVVQPNADRTAYTVQPGSYS
jgi:hypothetical protein